MRTKKTNQTKKAARDERTATAPRPETPVAAGPGGVTVAGGRVSVAVTLDLPSPSTTENLKWPWVNWNVEQLRKQLEKDLRRVAQTAANLEHVRAAVETRAAARAASRPVPAAVSVPAHSAGAPPVVEQ